MDYEYLHSQLTKLYRAYHAAIRRCKSSKNYIDVEFKFESFNQWCEELGLPENLSLTVDRIDPNGHYEPGNVRWLSQREQNYNRRLTAYVQYRGELIPFGKLCRQNGRNPQSVIRRIKDNRMSLEEAIDTPPYKIRESRRKAKVTAFGKTQSYAAWVAETGIPDRTLRKRIQEKGWPPERALTVPVDKKRQEIGRAGALKRYGK